jgi:hypothetical protein
MFYLLIFLFMVQGKSHNSTGKPCILLEGAGTKLTSVEWDGHEDTASSTTFTTMAENIIVKGITFKVRMRLAP